ncbi:MAG: hypothetical protein ACXACY_29850 [Candidatus Hodarchaeales archaeon]
MTDATDRQKYVKALHLNLETGGHLIIATFAIDGPTKCSGLDIVQYDSNKLLSELGEGFQLVEEMEEYHVTPTNKEQKFAYLRIKKTS